MPLVNCLLHGVKQIAVPWAEPGSQFTAWFERPAIDSLRTCVVTEMAGLLRLTWVKPWSSRERFHQVRDYANPEIARNFSTLWF